MNSMAGAVYIGKVAGYMTSLLGLCVLFYYGTNNEAFITKHRSVDNKGADVVSIVKPHSAEKTLPTVLPPMNEDAWFIDHGDGGLVDVDHATDQASVKIGVYLDPDADPAMFYTTQLTHQKNVGVFLDVEDEQDDLIIFGASPQRDIGMALDVDGEPSDLFLSETLHPQIVGVFLDADGNGVDSYFDMDNEAREVNVGEFIDSDTSDSLL